MKAPEFAWIAILLLLAACSNGGSDQQQTTGPAPPRPTSLVQMSGNNQSGTVAEPLPAPLVVAARDQFGDPSSGVTVQWTVTGGGGSLSAASPTTDPQGGAVAAVWTLGPAAGTANNVAQASAEGLSGSPITFVASAKSAGTISPRWLPRTAHTSLVFDSKLWVMGGIVAFRVNDVWFSSDGANWTEATASAAWAGRQGHSSLVFDAKMWVMGGRDNNEARLNDVWSSTDGVSWTEATSSAAWPPRSGHTSVIFDNKMWVIGGRRTTGFGPTDFLNDVWHSTDGVNWTEATSAAPWKQRHDHTSEVFDGKIWVIGGVLGLAVDPSSEIFSDVWRSTDGVTWIRETAVASWGPRSSHSSVVFGGKIWVLGGRNHTERFNDVWSSGNGSNWTVATSTAPWEVRQGHTSVVFDVKMWVLGGLRANIPLPERLNDIWHSGDGLNWTDATAGVP